MALNLTTADAALKEDYQSAIREQLNQTVMALVQFERNSEDIEGRRAVLSLHTSRNSGVGARADGGTLPTAGNQGYKEERVPVKFNYGRIQISGPTIKAMKSDKGSFARAVKSETTTLKNDSRLDVNRQVFGTADGVIATYANTTTGTTTITFVAATTDVQMRQILEGMLLDGGTVANPVADFTGIAVVSVNIAARTALVISAVTQTNNSKVFRSGSGGAVGGVGQKELTGLQAIVLDSGTLFNVDPAVTTSWKSTVNSNAGVNRAPTENLFARVLHAVAIAGGEDGNLILTSDGVFRAYANNLVSLKRFNNTLDLKGGFKGLSVSAGGGELGLAWDRDNPANTAYVLNTTHIIQYEMNDWEWMDEDGAVLSRVPNQDAYEATLTKYHELATDKRNAHAVIKDLLEA